MRMLLSSVVSWADMVVSLRYDQRWTFEDLTQSNVLLLHCIVCPYVFLLYVSFKCLNVGDDNDDV